ncbi:hypothetical protein PSECIP111951_01664 [Pseudoalteromonas holothuriae]|uniref:DUF2989 domain-containing protein n=1 Tax=Pseudoalteromonas holothuriae TaxID=2963714 RepID=A0A9W4VNG6_9GAMM|nr:MULTISPECIES: DUF2989 domain-containing protein [unclassified Pseudoalteromonas]CAH9051875.1 hypothetical protein PSECIP111854_00853 [Pseudoalteromonas sp. CIP111854]CAH9057418.1 hypothetical protein PSECIP111951_01664 [Pseudoalteromonas sp. CIP111951]
MALRQSIVLSVLLLAGCDDTITLSHVCNETPGLCSDLNTDSHCREERANVIIARYHEYKEPTDNNKYQLLKLFEGYNKCVSRAAKIEHIKLKEKTTSRVEGHLTSLKEMNRIFNETLDTSHPGLLYYHWSRNNNKAAMNKLLNMQDQKDVRNDSELQLFLATFYAKIDDDKTINILYRVLELNQAGQHPAAEVYETLTSIFYKQEKYKHAYTFAKVATLSGYTNVDIIPIENQLISAGKSLDSYDELAQQTYTQIQEGIFVSPREF